MSSPRRGAAAGHVSRGGGPVRANAVCYSQLGAPEGRSPSAGERAYPARIGNLQSVSVWDSVWLAKNPTAIRRTTLARPKEALISRRRSLEAALEIIDNEGLAALSIRRLADKLGVNGASLYHHFENKDEIITGAARLALEDVRAPDMESVSWREWLPQNARELRAALLLHPEIIPVVIGRSGVGLGPKRLDLSAKQLISEGVPSAAVMPMIEALELIAVGSALHESRSEGGDGTAALSNGEYPVLITVLRERGFSSEEIFDVIVSSVIGAFEEAIRERQARWLPTSAVSDTE